MGTKTRWKWGGLSRVRTDNWLQASSLTVFLLRPHKRFPQLLVSVHLLHRNGNNWRSEGSRISHNAGPSTRVSTAVVTLHGRLRVNQCSHVSTASSCPGSINFISLSVFAWTNMPDQPPPGSSSSIWVDVYFNLSGENKSEKKIK